MTIKLISEYITARHNVRDNLNIGDSIVYRYSGHIMNGIIIDVHEFMPQVKVQSETGKEYWAFWESIKEIK